MSKIRAEVRCCCDAGRLLGHIEVEKSMLQRDKITFMRRDGGGLTMEVGTLYPGILSDDLPYRAIKSMDLPAAELESIAGFEPFSAEAVAEMEKTSRDNMAGLEKYLLEVTGRG